VRRAAALLAAGALAFAGCGGGDDDNGGGSTTPDTKAIELPASLGSYKDVVDVTRTKSPSAVGPQRARVASTAKLTTAAYSAAFGGAASAFREYADAGLEQLPAVIAVRAEAPGITDGPVVDPKQLGLREAPSAVRRIGDVECLVNSQPTPLTQPADPSRQTAVQCQRAGSGVTVFVYGGGFTGAKGVAAMAKLADDAFAAVT
jgi:hypothetical protein